MVFSRIKLMSRYGYKEELLRVKFCGSFGACVLNEVFNENETIIAYLFWKGGVGEIRVSGHL